jgi:hypothetical protein
LGRAAIVIAVAVSIASARVVQLSGILAFAGVLASVVGLRIGRRPAAVFLGSRSIIRLGVVDPRVAYVSVFLHVGGVIARSVGGTVSRATVQLHPSSVVFPLLVAVPGRVRVEAQRGVRPSGADAFGLIAHQKAPAL